MELFWIAAFTSLTMATWVSSKQVVILNKPECDTCRWGWDLFKLSVAGINGWKDPSSLQSPKRRYSVCNVNPPQEPNNWLRSNLFSLQKARSVDVTVRYSVQPCVAQSKFCKESIDAYVWESNTTVTSDHFPDPIKNNDSFTRFAAFSRQSKDTSKITLQVKSNYILLGFRDQGGCKVLHSVKVSYNICRGKTLVESLVSLPETLAPANGFKPILVNGSCSPGSSLVRDNLYVPCGSTGQWNTSHPVGRCTCNEDMENIGGICEDCPDGMFNDKNVNGLNCTILPSAPRNANASFVNQSAVGIRWLPPLVAGDTSHVFYAVVCLKPCNINDENNCVEESCGSDVSYIPNKEGLNVTQVMVTNLLSFMNYTFKVYAMNRVSEVAKRKHGVEGNFTTITMRTTGTIPGKPEVSVEQTQDTVLVSWELEQKNGIIQSYHVKYIKKDDSSDTKTVTTKKMEQQFKDLKAGKTYEFQVIAENNFGKGPPGVKTFTLRNGGTTNKMVSAIAAASGGLLLIILIIVIVIIVLRRRKGHRSIEKDYMRSIEQGSELNSLDSMDQRRYIDPGNYLDLLELLSTFTSELERSKTKLEGLIGQGEFADVYKGKLKTQQGKDVVAVKVLRPGSSEKNQKDFLSEASIMGQFNHPNVIRLIGVVTQSRPMMIITEFLESGSLDHFLKARDGQLTTLQLIGMARGVASGMVYLSGMNFIHRDLAARNVLVGENMSCKVSDFGLSRELADDNPDSEYQTQGGKIPVRWTAPEALQHRKFSSLSDVWSFGILVWEIMSYSDRPYWDWNNYDVINRVETGYRLPPPEACPNVVHSLMLDCWDKDKNKRPKFSEIVSRLDGLIRSPESLTGNISPLQSTFVEEGIPEFRSVDDWLLYLNMETYLEAFKAANITSLNQITKMEDKDLKAAGIKLIGHRNKMNKSIKAMKSQFHNKGLDDDEAAI